MKREQYTVTFTSGDKTATVSGDELSGLVKSLSKEERVEECPRCHKCNFRRWIWLKRVMHKCLNCGRIWAYEAPK